MIQFQICLNRQFKTLHYGKCSFKISSSNGAKSLFWWSLNPALQFKISVSLFCWFLVGKSQLVTKIKYEVKLYLHLHLYCTYISRIFCYENIVKNGAQEENIRERCFNWNVMLSLLLLIIFFLVPVGTWCFIRKRSHLIVAKNPHLLKWPLT